MRHAIRTAAVVVALLCAGAAQAQPRSQMEGAEYFPLAKGTKWHYSVSGAEVTVTVTEIERVNGENRVRVESKAATATTATFEVYARRPGGLFRVQIGENVIDPPIKLLPAVLREGDSWAIDTTVAGQKLKGTFKVKGWEKLKTPAGGFDAILIAGDDIDLGGSAATMRFWYARNVGMVKTEFGLAGGVSVVLELSKFEPPGAPK